MRSPEKVIESLLMSVQKEKREPCGSAMKALHLWGSEGNGTRRRCLNNFSCETIEDRICEEEKALSPITKLLCLILSDSHVPNFRFWSMARSLAERR